AIHRPAPPRAAGHDPALRPPARRARRCAGVIQTSGDAASGHHARLMRRLEAGSRIVLASHNAGKLREIAALVRPFALEIVSAATLGLAEPEEPESDFLGNARLKARAAATEAGLPALADDSGLCVAGLGAAPGPLSARWAGPGHDFA